MPTRLGDGMMSCGAFRVRRSFEQESCCIGRPVQTTVVKSIEAASLI
jgi:hypothetical protein